MSRASEYANSVSSLYAQIGEARGREAANKGAIWSGALANIGDFVAQYPKQKAQMEELKNRAALTALEREKLDREKQHDTTDAADDQKIRDLFNQAHQEFQAGQGIVSPSDGVRIGEAIEQEKAAGTYQGPTQPAPTTSRTSPLPTPSEILRTVGPKKGIPIINGLAALKMDPQGDPEKTLKMLQSVANGLHALPEDLRAQAYPEIVKSFEQRGLVKPGALRPEYDPTYWQFIMGTGQEPSKPKDPQLVPVLGPDGNPVYGTPTAGAPVYEKPTASGDAKVGSFEDYVTRTYGKNPTSAQVLAARKAYGQADDRPRVDVSVNGGAGSLDPDGLELAATEYRLTHRLPARNAGQNGAIISAAAKQAKALGNSPAQTIQKQAAYAGDAKALSKMQSMSAAAEAFENKAVAQADLIADLSSKVPRTKYPIINAALQSGRVNIIGDENATKLANAIQTFSAEYAKIMEGSTGSAAGSSDSARTAASRLINTAMGKGTLVGVIDLMKREMGMTINGYGAVIGQITERMGGGAAPTQTPAVAPPTGRYNPQTGKIE